MFEVVKGTLYTKNPADRFHRKRDRRIRRAAGSKLASKPSGLNAFPRAFKSCKASQAGLLASRLRLFRRRLITVARPRGNFTRFPILPTPVGHLDAFEYKEQSDLGGHYHASFRVSNKAPAVVPQVGFGKANC